MSVSAVSEIERREADQAERAAAGVEDSAPLETARSEITGLRTPRFGRALFDHAPVGAILTSPLFYDQPLIDLCPYTHTAEDLEAVRWLSDDDLVIPLFANTAADYPSEAVPLIANGKSILSPRVKVLRRVARHRDEDTFLCGGCIQKDLGDTSAYTGRAGELISTSCHAIARLPANATATGIGLLREAIQAGDEVSLERVLRTLSTAAVAANAELLGAVPQVVGDNAGPAAVTEFAATALGISYSPNIPRQEYVGLMKDRCGVLSFVVNNPSTANLRHAAAIVTNLNREIEEIARSSVPALRRATTAVWHGSRRRLAEALLAGGAAATTVAPYGPVAAAGVAVACGLAAPVIDAIATAHLSEKATKVANRVGASLAGVSTEAFQIWALRERLRELGSQSDR